MATSLKNTHQSEGEGLNLELSLGPPSSLSPQHELQRPESIMFPMTLASSLPQTASLPLQLAPSTSSNQANDLSIEPSYPWWTYRLAMIHELAPSQPGPSQPAPSPPLKHGQYKRRVSDMPIGPPHPWSTNQQALTIHEPSQQRPSQPRPSQPAPSPPPKRRQYRKRATDMPIEPPYPQSTNDQEAIIHELAPSPPQPAQSPPSKGRRQRIKANDMAIEPPYPWSTNQRAKIHTMEYLRSNNIVTITGDVKCNECGKKYEMEYDLVEKFEVIARFVTRNGEDCHDRAPSSWVTPVRPNCIMCKQEKCIEPVIPDSDFKTINWLFLLLGQMLGSLKLNQLRYFCTHTNNHRTAAKDRLVYLTFINLCKQLQPSNTLFHA